jgi:hypothetical protein
MWLFEDTLWFFLNRKFIASGKKDDWRDKIWTIPYFYFIGSFAVLLCSYYVSRPFFISSLVLLLIILVSFPFQNKN